MSRCRALYFGLQVVSVSRLSVVGLSTATSVGLTTIDVSTSYLNLPGPCRHEDLIARVQLVEPVEGRAVGRAVAGDGGVAGLAGKGCVGVVAGALLQVGDADAG